MTITKFNQLTNHWWNIQMNLNLTQKIKGVFSLLFVFSSNITYLLERGAEYHSGLEKIKEAEQRGFNSNI